MQPGGVVLCPPHRDAAQAVVNVVVRSEQEVRVVVGDDRKVEFGGESLDQRVDAVLLGHAVTLHLQVEAGLAPGVGTECPGMPAGFLGGGLEVGLVAGGRAL